jgi:ankyrin repeat protein
MLKKLACALVIMCYSSYGMEDERLNPNEALLIAVSSGDREGVRRALEDGVDPNGDNKVRKEWLNSKRIVSNTVEAAVIAHNPEVLDLLLGAGADPNKADSLGVALAMVGCLARDKFKEPAGSQRYNSLAGSLQRNREIVQKLIHAGALIDEATCAIAPLCFYSDADEIVKELIMNGHDIPFPSGNWGYDIAIKRIFKDQPLVCAIISRKLKEAEELLAKIPHDTVLDEPLIYAAGQGRFTIVSLLIKRSFSSQALVRALGCAARAGYAQVASMLLKVIIDKNLLATAGVQDLINVLDRIIRSRLRTGGRLGDTSTIKKDLERALTIQEIQRLARPQERSYLGLLPRELLTELTLFLYAARS